MDRQKSKAHVNLMIICAHGLRRPHGAIAVIKFGNERLETKPAWESGTASLWADQFTINIKDSFELIEIVVYQERFSTFF